MKRVCILLLCAVSLLLLASCGGAAEPAFVIDGVPVSQGIFEYFRREALRGTDGADADAETAAQTAEAQCRRLVALDNYLKQHKITVRADLKSDVASRTEGQWALFGAHYREMGLTKQDLTRINSFDAQKKQLVQFFYGAGGKHEVAESELKESFVKLYVGFKAFEGALTTRAETGKLCRALGRLQGVRGRTDDAQRRRGNRAHAGRRAKRRARAVPADGRRSEQRR